MTMDRSHQLYERARRSIAGGVSSQVRLGERPVPTFFQHGKGSRLTDVDGNEYIDYVLGQGPDIFGHSPDFLLDAVAGEMGRGQAFAGQHDLEIEVAEAVQRVVPCAELVRFASSGSEAVHAAVRLARAYTGRPKLVKFEGHYHGWLDNVLYSGFPPLESAGPYEEPTAVAGSAGLAPGAAGEIVVLPWNDAGVLREALDRHQGEIAAVITEPIMCNANCIMPRPGYMEEMRRLCDERGIVLIFDEVVTGFRLGIGGAQERLGVVPDLATYAKAMAGGFPASMFAGKREIMGLLEDGTVVHAGTMNSNVMVMAAVRASLEKLMDGDGAVYRRLYASGQALMDGLRDLGRKHEVDLLVQGPGPVFCLSFTAADEIADYRSHARKTDHARYGSFYHGMRERGVRLTARGTWFVSTAHTDEDVERTLEAADETLASV